MELLNYRVIGQRYFALLVPEKTSAVVGVLTVQMRRLSSADLRRNFQAMSRKLDKLDCVAKCVKMWQKIW